ncbi:hypothetical protein N7499_004238 [Penicillium canescens]|uniref:Uncharacterized protein n=1 Tax=Penicillium canescens TaxID=5083 RepID=A0AAD6I1C3_PENCN|nr:hypothetical protein N7460_011202 [Penicillium canescens]KAJ6088056.1 hypothetical protein N7499_004238 [Penicillium canescens]
MALSQMDTVEAFSYLQSNLPALISRITDLAAHTSAKYTEYYEACRRQKSLRLRCPTNHSVRPVQPNEVVRIDQRRNPSKFDKSIAKAKDSLDSIQCSGRKRRADEDLPIGRNEPFAPMNKRHKVIIEYDGHTQKVLEDVVRDIDALSSKHTGQNSLFGEPAIGRIGSATSSCIKLSPPHTNRIRHDQWHWLQNPQKKSVIGLADKQLELAHELCETVAALRTGECISEINSVVKSLKKLLETTNTRLARVAAVATREPSAVGTSIIEIDDASYLSAESVNRLEGLL